MQRLAENFLFSQEKSEGMNRTDGKIFFIPRGKRFEQKVASYDPKTQLSTLMDLPAEFKFKISHRRMV